MKSVKTAMSLKRFLLRQEVVGMYREMLRTVRRAPAADRPALRAWVREEFELHRHVQDEALIKQHVLRGKKTFKELQKSLNLASS